MNEQTTNEQTGSDNAGLPPPEHREHVQRLPGESRVVGSDGIPRRGCSHRHRHPLKVGGEGKIEGGGGVGFEGFGLGLGGFWLS